MAIILWAGQKVIFEAAIKDVRAASDRRSHSQARSWGGRPPSLAEKLKMLSKVKIYVGFDPRESVVYHTFTQSLIEKSTLPIEITPLAVSTLNFYEETHQDKSNDFVYSRFLTPFMSNFEGWSIYVDGDMICQADIKELLNS